MIGSTSLAGFVSGRDSVLVLLGFFLNGMILGLWGVTILNIVSAALVLGTLTVTLLRRPLRASLSTTERRNSRPSSPPPRCSQTIG